jgi:hypothetical protein
MEWNACLFVQCSPSEFDWDYVFELAKIASNILQTARLLKIIEAKPTETSSCLLWLTCHQAYSHHKGHPFIILCHLYTRRPIPISKSTFETQHGWCVCLVFLLNTNDFSSSSQE